MGWNIVSGPHVGAWVTAQTEGAFDPNRSVAIGLERDGKLVAGTIAARFGISRNNHEECVTSVAKGFYESGFAQYQKADVGGTIKASGGVLGGGSETFLAQPIAYNIAPGKGALKDDIHVTDADSTKTLDASGSNPAMHQGGAAILQAMAVRRLTPVECERLQGFSDNYTDIKSKGKPTPDGPRYKNCKRFMLAKYNRGMSAKNIVDATCKCFYKSGYHTSNLWKVRSNLSTEYWTVKASFPEMEY